MPGIVVCTPSGTSVSTEKNHGEYRTLTWAPLSPCCTSNSNACVFQIIKIRLELLHLLHVKQMSLLHVSSPTGLSLILNRLARVSRLAETVQRTATEIRGSWLLMPRAGTACLHPATPANESHAHPPTQLAKKSPAIFVRNYLSCCILEKSCCILVRVVVWQHHRHQQQQLILCILRVSVCFVLFCIRSVLALKSLKPGKALTTSASPSARLSRLPRSPSSQEDVGPTCENECQSAGSLPIHRWNNDSPDTMEHEWQVSQLAPHRI